MRRRRRPGHRSAVLLAVLVVLLVGVTNSLVQGVFSEDTEGTFRDQSGTMGQAVPVLGTDVTVEKVEAAYAVARDASGSARSDATGMFLVVTLRGDAVRTDPPLGTSADLVYDGITTTLRGGQTLAPKPGFGERTRIYFDVDPDRLAGARLRVWGSEVVYTFRDRAVVDLGLDRAAVDRLRAAPRDRVMVVERATVWGLP